MILLPKITRLFFFRAKQTDNNTELECIVSHFPKRGKQYVLPAQLFYYICVYFEEEKGKGRGRRGRWVRRKWVESLRDRELPIWIVCLLLLTPTIWKNIL